MSGDGAETCNLSFLFSRGIIGWISLLGHSLYRFQFYLFLEAQEYKLILKVIHFCCRIVLERPEYGYATYFFELVESLPVDWQIKRLVTAMKLPCCSRTILLENKPLLVRYFWFFFFSLSCLYDLYEEQLLLYEGSYCFIR